MIDRLTLHRWLYRLLLLALASVVVFIRMLPMDVGVVRWPGPDLLLCLVFAWVMRRPDYVPALLAAAIFLTTDMLFQRPPGLWPALVVLGLEFLRTRDPLSRDLPFAVEWGLVAGVMVAMLLAERLLLGLFMVTQVSFGLSVLRLVMTVAVYPAVVLVTTQVLGVRKLQPGATDAMRQRA